MKRKLSLVFLHYLRILAILQYHKIRLLNLLIGKKTITVGITGSAGKTSCLLACEAALRQQYKVKINHEGNSESGIPLSILELKLRNYSLSEWIRIAFLAPIKFLTNWQRYEILLLEMGIDAPYPPKNMDYLLSIIKPDIGIFLNVSSVHLQNFTNIDQIAIEKAKLINLCSQAIVNNRDPLVKKYSKNSQKTIIKPIHLKIPNYTLPQIYDITFGAVYCLSKILKLTDKQIKQNLLTYFRLPPGRCGLLQAKKRCQIIDSSYNSSPIASLEMLKLLKNFPSPRIAVLGDMRELGLSSAKEHQKLYQSALVNSNLIISVGQETYQHFGNQAHKFLYWWQALKYLKNNLPANATILIKGSQNSIYLEELIKKLLKNPSDSKLLCRQSPYWLTVKKQFRNSLK